MIRFWRRLRLTLDMIKFEHSVFALPFALTGALLAWRDSEFAIQGLGWRFLWIVVAMVGARSAAMAFNRILDAGLTGETYGRPNGICRRVCSRRASHGDLRDQLHALYLVPRSELGFLCFAPGAARPGYSFLLFVFQALHASFRTSFWDFAWASRRPRPGSLCEARSIPYPLADGRRHLLDCGIRRHLRLSGF